MNDLAQLQSWLAAAQAAYHQLMIGQSAVEVIVDGGTFSTRFVKADADKLEAYIARLEGRIEALTFGARRAGAIGMIF